MLPGWLFLTNYISNPSGRIWVLWDPSSVSIKPICITDQMIHVEGTFIQTQTSFVGSFIYGHNYHILCRSLWNSLCHLSLQLHNSPWVAMGDFNIIRKEEDRLGGDQSWPSYIEEFNACCQSSLLDDLRSSGRHLTWSRGSGRNFISRKLDRALVNPAWLSTFTEAEATTLAPGESDHSPILVNIGMQSHVRKPPFRFFNFWADSSDFENLVSQAWSSPVLGNPQYIVSQKLKKLKVALKTLNKTSFNNIRNRTDIARDNLHHIQNQLYASPGNELLSSLEKKALQELITYIKAEESFSRQKSRALWLKDGDQNSIFSTTV